MKDKELRDAVDNLADRVKRLEQQKVEEIWSKLKRVEEKLWPTCPTCHQHLPVKPGGDREPVERRVVAGPFATRAEASEARGI
jgi:hypothetical protein